MCLGIRRKRRPSIIDLPLPVLPKRLIFSLALMLRLISCNTSAEPGEYDAETSPNATAPSPGYPRGGIVVSDGRLSGLISTSSCLSLVTATNRRLKTGPVLY
jgi:hypothetical protein